MFFFSLVTSSVVPESIRWHLLHGNFTEAEAVVKRTVTFNNLPFPRAVFDQIKNESTKQACSSTEQRKATIIDIFRSPALRKISLMLSVMW